MSSAGKRHMARVKQLPCVLCKHLGLSDDSPADAHHMKYGTGASDRAPDVLTIPLCKEHHQGASGVHMLKEKGLRLRYNVSELDLLAMTLEALA